MTTLTVVGRVTDAIGHAEHRSYQAVAVTPDRTLAVMQRRFAALASVEYRTAQPSPIPVRLGHGGETVGKCVHLERSAAGDITAITEIDGADHLLAVRGPMYWSPELRHRYDGSDIEITELAIVADPATVGLPPLELIPGEARHAADFVKCRHRPQLAAMLTRAAEADRRRHLGDAVVIADPSRTAELDAIRWGPVEQIDERHAGREEIHYSAPYRGVLAVR